MERWQLGSRIWIERGEDGEWGWSWEIRGAYGAVLMSGRCAEREAAERELAAGLVEVVGW